MLKLNKSKIFFIVAAFCFSFTNHTLVYAEGGASAEATDPYYVGGSSSGNECGKMSASTCRLHSKETRNFCYIQPYCENDSGLVWQRMAINDITSGKYPGVSFNSATDTVSVAGLSGTVASSGSIVGCYDSKNPNGGFVYRFGPIARRDFKS